MDADGQRSTSTGGMPSFVMDIGLPANRSKADIRSNITAITICFTFANIVANQEAVDPLLMKMQT